MCPLLLCDYLFGSMAAEVKAFLWQAIHEESLVYAAIAAEVEKDPSSPYAGPLAKLQSVAPSRAVTTAPAVA